VEWAPPPWGAFCQITLTSCSIPNAKAIFRRGTTNEGATNSVGVGKNRDSRTISGFIACCQRCDHQAFSIQLRRTVTSWWPWHSSLLSGVVCCSQETDDEVFMIRRLNVTPNTTEQNLIVRSGKSEAAITNTKRLRSRYCTVKANETDSKHRAASLRQQSYLYSNVLFCTATLLSPTAHCSSVCKSLLLLSVNLILPSFADVVNTRSLMHF